MIRLLLTYKFWILFGAAPKQRVNEWQSDFGTEHMRLSMYELDPIKFGVILTRFQMHPSICSF